MTIHDLVIKLLEHDSKTKVLLRSRDRFYPNISLIRLMHEGSMHIVLQPDYKPDKP